MDVNDKQLMEKVVSRETLYNGKVVHLEKWIVDLPDGRPAVREAVLHVGAAAIVAVDGEGRILLVRQCRVVLNRVLTEIPAGKLDAKGEDHLDAAKRELREETGVTARSWTHLTNLITSPGFCDEQIALYLASDLTQGETQWDDDEFLNVLRVPAPEVYHMVYSGVLNDSKTVSALLLARPLLEKMGIPT